MKKEYADKWIEALQSGEYKQCQQKLKDSVTNTYCCLGVLTELCGENPRIVVADDGDWLHPDIINLVGMKSKDGRICGETKTLAELNDSGFTFKEIADIIEKEWENL